MKSELCRCNNCDSILLDENPQVNAPLLDVPFGASSMVLLTDEDEFFWSCPNCGTDEFLADITTLD